MVADKFQIYGVKITGKYICESKSWICSFLLMPLSKTLPQFFIIIPQAEGNYPFLPNNVFWRSIFPQQKGDRGGLWSERICQNLAYEGIGHKFW